MSSFQGNFSFTNEYINLNFSNYFPLTLMFYYKFSIRIFCSPDNYSSNIWCFTGLCSDRKVMTPILRNVMEVVTIYTMNT